MSFYRTVVAALSLVGLVVACSSSSSSDPNQGGGEGGSFSCSCCINGTNYSCPDEDSCNDCSAPKLDPSGCKETGTNAGGVCN